MNAEEINAGKPILLEVNLSKPSSNLQIITARFLDTSYRFIRIAKIVRFSLSFLLSRSTRTSPSQNSNSLHLECFRQMYNGMVKIKNGFLLPFEFSFKTLIVTREIFHQKHKYRILLLLSFVYLVLEIQMLFVSLPFFFRSVTSDFARNVLPDPWTPVKTTILFWSKHLLACWNENNCSSALFDLSVLSLRRSLVSSSPRSSFCGDFLQPKHWINY